MTGQRQRRHAASRAPREFVDFASVPPSQWAVHDRLENWARWSRGASGEGARTGDSAPMFRLHQSDDAQRRRYGEETAVPVDKGDALKIHFAVIAPDFPPQQRRALQWSYLRPRDPAGTAAELGVDLAGLRDLVRDGRQTLVERNV